MRLMFLTPFPPRLDGAHGGARAIAELLVRLAPRHSLGVLYLRTKEESPIDEVLQKQCEWTEEIIRPNERERGMFQMWRALVGRQPVWVNDWCVPAYAERVRQRAQTWQPEIVQIEFHIMGQYVAALRDCPAPRVLVEHEPGVAAAHESYDFKQVRGRIVPYLDVLAWEQYERAILKQVDSVVVFTPQDRQAISALNASTPIVTIPLGIEIPKRPLNPAGDAPPNILFIGNFKHPPNIDAANYLARTIFPHMRAHFPELKLYLVGENPPLLSRQLNTENIIVTGRVADVTPYLDRASVVVVPLRHGGGMRVKVLEALAAGKAVVATHRAVEGLDVRNGEQVIVADEEREICDAIEHLLAASQERIQLAQRARVWACSQLTWDKSVHAYEALYEQLARGAK